MKTIRVRKSKDSDRYHESEIIDFLLVADITIKTFDLLFLKMLMTYIPYCNRYLTSQPTSRECELQIHRAPFSKEIKAQIPEDMFRLETQAIYQMGAEFIIFDVLEKKIEDLNQTEILKQYFNLSEIAPETLLTGSVASTRELMRNILGE